MGWNKTSWFDVIGTDIAKQTINAGNTTSGEIDCTQTNPYIKVSVKVSVDFGATPDGDAIVNIYGVDDASGGADESDTVPIWTQRIERVASSEKIITIPNLDVMAIDTLKIEVENQDTTDSIDVWVSAIAAYKN